MATNLFAPTDFTFDVIGKALTSETSLLFVRLSPLLRLVKLRARIRRQLYTFSPVHYKRNSCNTSRVVFSVEEQHGQRVALRLVERGQEIGAARASEQQRRSAR